MESWKDPPFFMGKITSSMVVIFHSYVKLPGGVTIRLHKSTAFFSKEQFSYVLPNKRAYFSHMVSYNDHRPFVSGNEAAEPLGRCQVMSLFFIH